MKIAVMEKTNFSKEQIEILNNLGTVEFYDGLSQEEANKIAPRFDVVIVNWLDPTPFILKMKPGSLVALLSTGYGWINNIKEAYDKGIFVSNIPSYSTEAVAEHLLGLLIGVSKNIFSMLNKANNDKIGFEIKGKTIGIIGLGNIGKRFAEIMNFFGANIVTYNRHSKNNDFAKDVSLESLISQSDVICVTCSQNESSKNLINSTNIKSVKKGAIIIGSTWGVVEETALCQALESGIISNVSFDAATEGNEKISSMLNNYKDKVYFTPHIAYNTYESEKKQLDICIDNIIQFSNGIKSNIVF